MSNTEIMWTCVVLESPFAGITSEVHEGNVAYARFCLRDMLVVHHEAPFASHLLYTQPRVFNDGDPKERNLGIAAGFTWRRQAKYTAVYTDRGISYGMELGIQDALSINQPIIYRTLPKPIVQRLKVEYPDGWVTIKQP